MRRQPLRELFRTVVSGCHPHDFHRACLRIARGQLAEGSAALQKLICAFQERPPELTAYRSTHDGLPEPLCALYPAGSARELQTLAEKLGKSCPRKLLIVQEARLVEQDNPRSLDNINTTLEYEQTRL